MNFTFTRFASTIGLLTALAPLPAVAATVSYTFSVAIDATSTQLPGASFSGSFAFDDQSGSTAFGETSFALDAFSFTFNGTTYTQATPQFAGVAVSVENGEFLGLSGGQAGVFEFTQGIVDSTDAFFSFRLNGDDNFGAVSYRLSPNNVPEPATGGLLAAALLGVWARRSFKVSR